jgi:hypothetical protein
MRNALATLGLAAFAAAASTWLMESTDAHVVPGEYSMYVIAPDSAAIGRQFEIRTGIEHGFPPVDCYYRGYPNHMLPPQQGCYIIANWHIKFDPSVVQLASDFVKEPAFPAICRTFQEPTFWVLNCSESPPGEPLTYSGPTWSFRAVCIAEGSTSFELYPDLVYGEDLVPVRHVHNDTIACGGAGAPPPPPPPAPTPPPAAPPNPPPTVQPTPLATRTLSGTGAITGPDTGSGGDAD